MKTSKSKLFKAIRFRCLDCSAEQPKEVLLCWDRNCALHPYRMGRDPMPERVELQVSEKTEKPQEKTN